MTDLLMRFPPDRAAALQRLQEFVPSAGRRYETGRNTDAGPDAPTAVSRLSPYLRYRIVTELEVVAAVTQAHGLAASEKFVQEVLWRTYWKGWLEMRPSIWMRYLDERDQQRQNIKNSRWLDAAESGNTGFDGFDDWARELVATGYLHNHARMWFASIWIFTLKLPWVLGADFFLRHLVDADAASNTLSWRWVAGLQTAGKAYLATTENIERYTKGRFSPVGLATQAIPLTEPPINAARRLPESREPDVGVPSLLLVTPEDMHAESLIGAGPPLVAALVTAARAQLWGDAARTFVDSAAGDTASRMAAHYRCPVQVVDELDAAAIVSAARDAGVRQVVTPYAPVGPVADALAEIGLTLAGEGLMLTQVRRPWDERFWPYAKKGFFAFKEQIPMVLRETIPG